MRKIVVNDQEFFWTFSGRWRLTCFVNRLSIVLGSDRNVRVHIQFHCKDTPYSGNPLNEGLQLWKNGQQESFNLNRPKYVAQIIEHLCRSNPASLGHRGLTCIEDGKALLEAIGYREEPSTFSYLMSSNSDTSAD